MSLTLFSPFITQPSEGRAAGPFKYSVGQGKALGFPLIGNESQSDDAFLSFNGDKWPGHGKIFRAAHKNFRRRGVALCTAESCTGGLIAARLSDFAGASDYLRGSWVVYSNEMKSRWLGVPNETLQSQGAVSEATVRALIEGVWAGSDASHALAVSGIAGPGGGSPEKPVGTVWIAAGLRSGGTIVRHFLFEGARKRVRWDAADAGVLMLMELIYLEEIGVDVSISM